jgi:hypothetical protein
VRGRREATSRTHGWAAPEEGGWRDRGKAVQQPEGRSPLVAAGRPIKTAAGGIGQFREPPAEPQPLPRVVNRPVQLRPDQLRGELLEVARPVAATGVAARPRTLRMESSNAGAAAGRTSWVR